MGGKGFLKSRRRGKRVGSVLKKKLLQDIFKVDLFK